MSCVFEGCNKTAENKTGKYAGLCTAHKWQKARNGKLKPVSLRTAAVEDRFLQYVEKTDSCWMWTGNLSDKGYGRFTLDGKSRRAHRLAYSFWVQEVSDLDVVHHTCGVRNCVNPEHLQVVTTAENVAEMLERQSYLARIKELEEQLSAALSTKKGWWRRGK